MTTPFTNRLSVVRSGFSSGLFPPLFLVLTLVAALHSLQTYSVVSTGSGTPPALVPILLSKLAYYWYFALLAFAVYRHSRRIVLTRGTALRWSAVHAGTLACSFLVHEALSGAVDALVLGTERSAGLIVLLFNNPAVWIETFAYVIFLLGFTLLEYQRINRENEIKCLLLEARLTETTLQELRNTIQPAFLFDTIRSILALVREHRNEEANRVLSLLSDFLRTAVYDDSRDDLAMEEKMRLLNQMIETEMRRIRIPGRGVSPAAEGTVNGESAS